MSHRLNRFVNSFKQEAELRNVLPEIKDVAKALGNLQKQSREGLKEVSKWQALQEQPLQDFLQAMSKCEEDGNAATAEYEEGYMKFYQFWKDILAERKELKALSKAHEKAAEEIEKLKKQLAASEKKADPNEAKIKFNLEKATTEEKELRSQLNVKMYEVQREMHQLLRSAYYSLHETRHNYYKRCAFISESAIKIIEDFKTVGEYKEATGEFEYVPCAESAGKLVGTRWHHGDELIKLLQMQKQSSEKSLESSLSGLRGDLESQLSALKQQLEKEREEWKRQAEEERASADKRLFTDTLQLAIDLGTQGVQDAKTSVETDIVDFLISKAQEARSANQMLSEVPLASLAILCRSLVGTLFSAMGAAHTLQDGQSRELFPLARTCAEASLAVLNRVHVEIVEKGNSTASAGAEGQSLEKSLDALIAFGKSVAIVADIPKEVHESITRAQQMIKEALEQIAAMSTQSQQMDRERVLEVNTALLSDAKTMMERAKVVIDSAVAMQAELGSEEGVAIAESERKLKQRKWTSALEGAVNNIVDAAPLWIECLRQVSKGKGKHEEMQVATRQISACSAQLVAFINTQCPHSAHGKEVVKGSDELVKSSHTLLNSVREAQNLALASLLLQDYGSLSENQAKKLVMATQVEVLRLESALSREREKLAQLRKLNYATS